MTTTITTLLIAAGIFSSAVVGYVLNYIYWSRKRTALNLASSIMTFLLLVSGALPMVALSCVVDGYDSLTAACFGAALFGGYQGAWRALPLVNRESRRLATSLPRDLSLKSSEQ